MSDDLEQKQLYLRGEIIDKGYDAQEFSYFMQNLKNNEEIDLDNWTMEELQQAVQMFINNINQQSNENVVANEIPVQGDSEPTQEIKEEPVVEKNEEIKEEIKEEVKKETKKTSISEILNQAKKEEKTNDTKKSKNDFEIISEKDINQM